MFFSSLIRWFYCLPISTILLFTASAGYLFFLARNALARRLWWRWACLLFFLLWAACVLWMTLFSRGMEPAFFPPEPLFQSYRRLLLGEDWEILRSNFMNLVLFFPAGLLMSQLLPGTWSRGVRLLLSVVLLVLFSGSIELLQYRHMLGRAEADDVLHNGAGALLGFLSHLLFPPE